MRQAANLAINRDDVIQYATKGNGEVIPALLSPQEFGFNADLKPYPFDPGKARRLVQEAGYRDGLAVALIAPEELRSQATVVGRMLEQVGFRTKVQVLEPVVFNQRTMLSHLDAPAEQQAWDIALTVEFDLENFPVLGIYHYHSLDGPYDWVLEERELRELYERVLRTADRSKQQDLIRQMERHISEQAYFLFLYRPVELFAVNKAVELVPYRVPILFFHETSVTDDHWSARRRREAEVKG